MHNLTTAEREILPLLCPLRKHLEATLSPTLLAKLSVDDIVQETYLKAVAAFPNADFKNDFMILGWLKRIAINISISFIRKRDATTSLFSNNSKDMAQVLLDTGELTPSAFVSAEENRQLLALALGKLNDTHQRIVHLRYENKLTFEAIAKELETTSGAVRGLHRNALEKLREYLGDMARFLSSAQ